jgi:NADH dehydrogenase [ubiquinone] 1 alpha subcomplex assembly factor 2
VLRQGQLKILAAQADARWAAKPSYVDGPGRQRGQPLPALKLKDPGRYTQMGRLDERAVEGGSDIEGRVENRIERSQEEVPGIEIQIPDEKRHPFTRKERAHQTTKENSEDPWRKARGGLSEEWQPEAWDPNALIAKR